MIELPFNETIFSQDPIPRNDLLSKKLAEHPNDELNLAIFPLIYCLCRRDVMLKIER